MKIPEILVCAACFEPFKEEGLRYDEYQPVVTDYVCLVCQEAEEDDE